ncbi:hypothetical protein KIN20_008928 [Parelaphostrongylus tenuis]|uniref:Uncharacterized protein n=1 Tax=Parelaphostrongylus tenuis TaxID=148309 RepID=A0AAD5MRU6_PARTN|nr:hypothetical protein KIN20_008928 [Parelaphostrongylus tenuis]
MSTTDSVVIRRQIGLFKKLPLRYVSSLNQTLNECKIQSGQTNFSQFDDSQMESLCSELGTFKSNLLCAYSRIIKTHSKWLTLKKSNSSESDTFEEYIANYSDYRKTISDSVLQLKNLDSLLTSANCVFHNRGVRVPSDSSDKEDLAVTQPNHNSVVPQLPRTFPYSISWRFLFV